MVQFPAQLVQAASWWADPSCSEDTAPPNRVSDLRLLVTNTSTSGHQVGNLGDFRLVKCAIAWSLHMALGHYALEPNAELCQDY